MVNETEEIIDTPSESGREHVKRYLETDGADGHEWRGVHTLLLVTRGRKTGKLHRTALIYGKHGKRYIIVASKGGAPQNPQWYLNLTDNPEVQVQVLADKFTATARTATKFEKPELWKLMCGVWPAYNDYQDKSPRQIPVVILERK